MIPDAETAASLGLQPGRKIVYYPRRGFDLWNSKYFVLPRRPDNTEVRGYASFLPDSERVYPPPEEVGEVDTDEAARRWGKRPGLIIACV